MEVLMAVHTLKAKRKDSTTVVITLQQNHKGYSIDVVAPTDITWAQGESLGGTAEDALIAILEANGITQPDV